MSKQPTQQQQTEGDELEQLITLGHVSGVQGLQGWVKVFSDTDPRENITRYSDILLKQDGQWQKQKISSGRRQGKNVVLKIKGCNDREQAELLVGSEIAIMRSQLPETEVAGEYYWSDLQGLAVKTTKDVELGNIERLFDTGANNVIVVTGDKERLIPYIWQQVVMEVDLENRQMVVDWDPEF